MIAGKRIRFIVVRDLRRPLIKSLKQTGRIRTVQKILLIFGHVLFAAGLLIPAVAARELESHHVLEGYFVSVIVLPDAVIQFIPAQVDFQCNHCIRKNCLLIA